MYSSAIVSAITSAKANTPCSLPIGKSSWTSPTNNCARQINYDGPHGGLLPNHAKGLECAVFRRLLFVSPGTLRKRRNTAHSKRFAMKVNLIAIPGSITAPRGFRASGVFCDIKRLGTGKGSDKGKKRDLALIVSDGRATVAGMFTTNQVCAAPVKVCVERVKKGQ